MNRPDECSHGPGKWCWDCVSAEDVSWWRLADWSAVAVWVGYLTLLAVVAWHVVR